MGMYDYMGGEQIKIFYTPIFNRNKEEISRSSFWHSGGQLRSFGSEDELPLKSLYYCYPKTFMVYDYRFEYTDVWIVENGRFKKIVHYESFGDARIECPVFDYYGHQIRIQTGSDFQAMKTDLQNALEKEREIERSHFPIGTIQTIKTNLAEFQSKEEAYYAELNQHRSIFSTKWYVKPYDMLEREFGGLLDCFLFLRQRKDDEPLKDIIIPAEDYLAGKETLKRLIGEHPDLIQQYKRWLNDEEMLDSIDFEQIVSEIIS